MLRNLINTNKLELSKFAVNAVAELDMLLRIVEKEKLDKSNKFEFNDLDNHVWQDKPNSVSFDNQGTVMLAVKCPDKTEGKYGWQVYMVEKDDNGAYEKQYKKVLKESAQSTLERANYYIEKNHVITFKPIDMMTFLDYYEHLGFSETERKKLFHDFLDGKENNQYVVTSFNGNLYHADHALMEINNVAEVLSSQFKEQALLPVDINSPEYQLKQSYFSYPKSQADFFLRALMSNGSGYNWNHNGELVALDTAYNPDIDKIDINHIEYPKVTYLYSPIEKNCHLVNYPSNITPEWQEARQVLISKLKEVISEFSSWEKAHQDNFLHADNYRRFTIEDFVDFVSLAENGKTKKLKP